MASVVFLKFVEQFDESRWFEEQPSGAKQAAEKGMDSNERPQKHTSGPEGPIDSVRLIPGLKPRPTTRASFSAACKAHSFCDLYGTTKVVP
jgi:hypothetical protein